MIWISNSQHLFPTALHHVVFGQFRHLSKYLDKNYSSKAIRQNFIDYFVNDHGHTFVRSSPVMPFCDPTVAFVNAGMNQFKGIFLGTHTTEHRKVANYQKCIRVGGKHNDLNVVGTDGYHHTFFEMLGNWSFGNCAKEEACQLAWNLLTNHYKLNKSTLYVTYFGGDNQLGLLPDLECKEIWRSIGVHEERILPFGLNENFWEMGITGPCGPCTEIHIDLRGTDCRSSFVNKGLSDLTELWNIVFIQFNRNADGTIEPLSNKHIDTGMGFERLTAVLQGKVSNYDTDLFQNLFTAIYKISKKTPEYRGMFGEKDWDCLDTNYRILADHSRMITACLADGMIPEQNQKLRKVLRKSFLISETIFQRNQGLVREITNYVVENLGHAYPEMERNIKQVHQIIDYEEELYQLLRKTSLDEWSRLCIVEPRLQSLDIIEMPGLIAAYKEIKESKTRTITPQFGFKLYDTFGLDEESIIKLSNALDITFDLDGFRNELQNSKQRSREITKFPHEMLNSLNSINIPTDDSYKYLYTRTNEKTYDFEKLSVKILGVMKEGSLVDVLKPDEEYILLLDKTNLYSKAGGQESDNGILKITNNRKFLISDVQKMGRYVLHCGIFKSDDIINITDTLEGILSVDVPKRIKNMQNHTAVHLLNSALKDTMGLTCQKSSKVNEHLLSLDVGLFGNKISINDITSIENCVNNIIQKHVPVSTRIIHSQMLNEEKDLTFIPGEIYPESEIRLIEMKTSSGLISKEPCCGTHIANTEDLQDFCVVGFRSIGRSTASITAFTGAAARKARENSCQQLQDIINLQKHIQHVTDANLLQHTVSSLQHKLKRFDLDSNAVLPIIDKVKCLDLLDSINKQLKLVSKNSLKSFIEMEMKNALETNLGVTKNNHRFVVHYLESSTMLEAIPLQKATKLCENLPVLVVSYTENMVKARCCVPKDLCNGEFNAEKWLQKSIGNIFKSSISSPKGQDGSLVCNMKSIKINSQDFDILLSEGLKIAKDYAEKHL